MKLRILICCALGILVLGVFWQTGHFEFINYDDDLYIETNQYVRNGITWDGVKWAFTSIDFYYWQPLTWLSLMLDSDLFGVNPGAFHLENVFLHLAATILLFLLLDRTTGALRPSAFAAALFGIHPLRVESVAWVVERKDVLSGVFFMLTLLAYILYVEKPSFRRYVVVLMMFVCGLATKPMLVIVPPLLMIFDFWPLRRPPAVREKLPLFALSLAIGTMTLIGQTRMGAVSSIDRLDVWGRISVSATAYATYLWKMIWPTKLAILYPYRGLPSTGEVIGAIAVVVAITALVIRQRQRPYLVTGWCWYLAALLPVSGLIQSGPQAMADRFTYLPLIGLFIAIAYLPWPKIAAYPAIAVVLALAGVSYAQTTYWRNNFTLYEHALAVTHDNAICEQNLGHALVQAGRFSEAVPHLQHAIQIAPQQIEAHYNLATALMQLGRPAEAVPHLEAVLGTPHLNTLKAADAENHLAIALVNTGRLSEAGPHFMQITRLRPDSGEAHNNYGAWLMQNGRTQEAIDEFRVAVRLNPNNPQAQRNLQSLLKTISR